MYRSYLFCANYAMFVLSVLLKTARRILMLLRYFRPSLLTFLHVSITKQLFLSTMSHCSTTARGKVHYTEHVLEYAVKTVVLLYCILCQLLELAAVRPLGECFSHDLPVYPFISEPLSSFRSNYYVLSFPRRPTHRGLIEGI